MNEKPEKPAAEKPEKPAAPPPPARPSAPRSKRASGAESAEARGRRLNAEHKAALSKDVEGYASALDAVVAAGAEGDLIKARVVAYRPGGPGSGRKKKGDIYVLDDESPAEDVDEAILVFSSGQKWLAKAAGHGNFRVVDVKKLCG